MITFAPRIKKTIRRHETFVTFAGNAADNNKGGGWPGGVYQHRTTCLCLPCTAELSSTVAVQAGRTLQGNITSGSEKNGAESMWDLRKIEIINSSASMRQQNLDSGDQYLDYANKIIFFNNLHNVFKNSVFFFVFNFFYYFCKIIYFDQ